MSRVLIPGRVDRDGVAHPTCFCASVSGTCRQGRSCPLRESELANEEPPHEQFATPARTRADDAYRAQALRRMIGTALAAWAGLALILYFAAKH